MKTSKHEIEILHAELCEVSGMPGTLQDALKAGKGGYLIVNGGNGKYNLRVKDAVKGTIHNVFQTPYTPSVMNINELHAHLTGIIAGLKAFSEAFKQLQDY